jgi:hypothetical protein
MSYFAITFAVNAYVKAGVKAGHWGGAKAGQFDVGVDRNVPCPARRG